MNRLEILSAVRTITLVESTHVTDAFIHLLINQGLYEISAASDWPFLQTSSTLSTTAATRTVALPATFLRGIALVDDDSDNYVTYVDPVRFFERIGNDTGNTGTEFDEWTTFGSNVYLSPIPSETDTARFTLYFYSTATALAADVDVPQIPVPYHWMLVEYCKWKLYEREEYFEQAQAAFQSYARYLDDMVAFYNNRVAFSTSVWGGGRAWSGRGPFPNVPWWNRV